MGTSQAWNEMLAQAREQVEGDADPNRLDELAEREARLDWIRERWTAIWPCSVCGNRKWLVSDPGAIGPQVIAYPVTCRYCGNTHLLEPKLADLDEPTTD